MSSRQQALQATRQVLFPRLAELYAIDPDRILLHPDHEGSQNLVFFSERDTEGAPARLVLRVSFRDDRPADRVHAELDFVRHLHANGASVSPPVASREGRYLEEFGSAGREYSAVCFERAPGDRLPDRGYRYRDGAPLEEFYGNWGALLGRMHRLAGEYTPPPNPTPGAPPRQRPRWLDIMADHHIPQYLPPHLDKVGDRFRALIAEVEALGTAAGTYGLIHADLNDGNMCIDYATGALTAFDFDDCAYSWFMYDLADAWKGGLGWIAHEPSPSKRRAHMDRHFATLLEGYAREHTLPAGWPDRLPVFLKLIEMESMLDRLRRPAPDGDGDEDDDMRPYLAYQQTCVEQDIPYLGFFDTVYSADHPFALG